MHTLHNVLLVHFKADRQWSNHRSKLRMVSRGLSLSKWAASSTKWEAIDKSSNSSSKLLAPKIPRQCSSHSCPSSESFDHLRVAKPSPQDGTPVHHTHKRPLLNHDHSTDKSYPTSFGVLLPAWLADELYHVKPTLTEYEIRCWTQQPFVPPWQPYVPLFAFLAEAFDPELHPSWS